ncbi:MAG: phosphoribosylglycinamide formyltransferase [Candidatus Omnitrophica bacterium]|nr:phosphoribosylglycinamide formyltransferase [Candidatus Omnitrophota bacterium]
MNLAIFASGNGSNFSAIVKAIRQSRIKAKLVILVCDRPRAFVVKRAKKEKVRVVLVRREDFVSRADFEMAIIQRLRSYKIDLIALAGFMRMLSPSFVRRYRKRILNIHPSLLPAFKGSHAIKDAIDHKASFTGVTVHFVDEQMDHGPVILQERIKIRSNDTLSLLEKRIHALEHRMYPRVIELFCSGRIKYPKRPGI